MVGARNRRDLRRRSARRSPPHAQVRTRRTMRADHVVERGREQHAGRSPRALGPRRAARDRRRAGRPRRRRALRQPDEGGLAVLLGLGHANGPARRRRIATVARRSSRVARTTPSSDETHTPAGAGLEYLRAGRPESREDGLPTVRRRIVGLPGTRRRARRRTAGRHGSRNSLRLSTPRGCPRRAAACASLR